MEVPRSFIVEFAGMPKSGKTTIMDIVSHYLRRCGIPISEFHGGGRYAPLGKSNLGRLNLYLACEAVRYCMATHAEGTDARIHLMDRGLTDRLLFTNALVAMSRTTQEHRDAVSNLFQAPELRDEVDLCFLFVTTPSISLLREEKNKLTMRSGRVMNNDFLTCLREAAEGFAADGGNASFVKHVVLVDTGSADGDVVKTAETVVLRLLDELKDIGLELPLPVMENG